MLQKTLLRSLVDLWLDQTICYELFDFKNTIIFKTIIYRVTGLPQICFDCTALYTAYTVDTV